MNRPMSRSKIRPSRTFRSASSTAFGPICRAGDEQVPSDVPGVAGDPPKLGITNLLENHSWDGRSPANRRQRWNLEGGFTRLFHGRPRPPVSHSDPRPDVATRRMHQGEPTSSCAYSYVLAATVRHRLTAPGPAMQGGSGVRRGVIALLLADPGQEVRGDPLLRADLLVDREGAAGMVRCAHLRASISADDRAALATAWTRAPRRRRAGADAVPLRRSGCTRARSRVRTRHRGTLGRRPGRSRASPRCLLEPSAAVRKP